MMRRHSKKFIARYVAFGVAWVFALVLLAGPASAGSNKVDICHIPPDDPANFHTITISEKAFQAHLAHGDLGGPCSAFCADLCDDGDACTIDDIGDCEQTGQCPGTALPVDCNDQNECTTDSCNSASGCVNTPRLNEPCDDGQVCSGPDTCNANGACQGAAIDNCCLGDEDCSQDPCDQASCNLGTNRCGENPVVCNPPDLCSVSACAPDTGGCVDSPVACSEGESCDLDSGDCVADVACVPAPAGMISWWDGDAGAGTTAVDIQNSNDGSLFGDTARVAGKVANAFSFDGTGDYIQVPRNTSLEPQEITLDAWVEASALSNSFHTIIGKQANGVVGTGLGAGNASYTLGINPSGHVRVGFFNGTATALAISQDPIFTGVFYHVAATRNGSDIRLYIDGVEVATATMTGNIVYNTNPGYDVEIGTYLRLNGRFSFIGLIDEVEIFNRALTTAEIQDIFNAGSDGKCKP